MKINQLEQKNTNKEDEKEQQKDVVNVSLEDISKNIENSAQIDLTNFEKFNDNFIEQGKKRFGITENNPALEKEILTIKEKYKNEKKKLKSSFLSKFLKIVKYTTDSVVLLALTAHFTQKEFPDYLNKQKEKEPNKIEWNESTKKEIQELAQDYTVMMKKDTSYEGVPDSVFKNRFIEFVQTWGPDIEIVYIGENKTLGEEIAKWTDKYIYHRSDNHAHYYNNTIYYDSKETRMKNYKKDPENLNIDTSGVRDFVAELSHHINKDYSWGRSIAYVENLLSHGFKQSEMYEDPYSPEYQAHSITQDAIAKYLDPRDHEKNNLDVDFVDIYNIELEYYKEIIKTNGYENSEQLEDLQFHLLYFKDFKDILKDKQVVFKNLREIRTMIDETNLSKDDKSDLFGIMTTIFPLANLNNNYETVSKEYENISNIFNIKKNTLKDPDEFKHLASLLENKFTTDSEYVYVSLVEKIFNDEFIWKMEENSESNEFKFNKDIDKLYKLNMYGIAKSLEGNSIGYKNSVDYPLQWVREHYESYLYRIKNHLDPNSADNQKIDAQILDSKRTGYAVKILEYYTKNNKEELDENVESYLEELRNKETWQYKIIMKLKNGLEKYGNVNLKRDFFENGKSPLLKILE